jgi:hypothetical protein
VRVLLQVVVLRHVFFPLPVVLLPVVVLHREYVRE